MSKALLFVMATRLSRCRSAAGVTRTQADARDRVGAYAGSVGEAV